MGVDRLTFNAYYSDMLFLDKYGWPVETVKGRWFHSLLRRVIHTRKIRRGKRLCETSADVSVGHLPTTPETKLTEFERKTIIAKARSRVRGRSPHPRKRDRS